MPKLKRQFSIRLKKSVNENVVRFLNRQSNVSDTIAYLFEKEILENGIQNLSGEELKKTTNKEEEIIRAAEELRAAGKKVNFTSISEKTKISKSTLYNNEALKRIVKKYREKDYEYLVDLETKTKQVMCSLKSKGYDVNFSSIAKALGISKSLLYNNSTLKQLIANNRTVPSNIQSRLNKEKEKTKCQD